MIELTDNQKIVLKGLRTLYGDVAQILVSIEELNELACVLAKYPRYDNKAEAREKLHNKALDEVADVIVILDHVQNILGLNDSEIKQRIDKKMNRAERWLDSNNGFSQTLKDRKVDD